MKYKSRKSISSDHDGKSMNHMKPQCVAGATARSEGKHASDNPYPVDTQANRRWVRGFNDAKNIMNKINPVPMNENGVPIAPDTIPKAKRVYKKKITI